MRLRQSLLEWEVIHRCGEGLHSFTFKVPQLKFSFIMAVRVFEVTDLRSHKFVITTAYWHSRVPRWSKVSEERYPLNLWGSAGLSHGFILKNGFKERTLLSILCSTTCLSASGAAAAGVSAALSLAPCSQIIIINNFSQFNTRYIRDNVSLARRNNHHVTATISPEGELEPAGNWGKAGFSAPESCLV